MNIYDRYPTSVVYKDQSYALDLSYDRVLRAIDINDEDCLTFADKIEVQVSLLLASPADCPENLEDQVGLLNAIFSLFPKGESEERYIDFHQDAAIIRSAFFRIGVDLTKDRLHFMQFLELLADLPEDTALMRTVDIRRRPLPPLTKENMQQVRALQEAKARVAIRYSEEERMARFADSLKKSTVLKG